MSVYASGKHAHGICDRCGFVYPLRKLKAQVIDSKESGLLVCSSCLDIDQEQLQLGKIRFEDPQSLRDPRPDNQRAQSGAGSFGWNPVGHEIDLKTDVVVGQVRIT